MQGNARLSKSRTVIALSTISATYQAISSPLIARVSYICAIPGALASSTDKSSSSDDVICQTEISHLLTCVGNETARDVRPLMSCLRRRRTRPGRFCPRLLHEAGRSTLTLSTCARLVSPRDGAGRHHFVLVRSGYCVHVELVSRVNALTQTLHVCRANTCGRMAECLYHGLTTYIREFPAAGS